MNSILNEINQRMSLREPQRNALQAAARFVELAGIQKNQDLNAVLTKTAPHFPLLQEFESSFVNVCLTLATGVGKTRLMGALIAYLVHAHNVRHFLILAPNRTILEKLEREFKNPSDSKYVFQGLGELGSRMKIITSENYEQGQGIRNDRSLEQNFLDSQEIHINIFNIAMIHTRKDEARKMKRGSDYIPEGYFHYLANLSDLVVLMDEGHRYRSTGALQAINELKPVLGFELTATPYIERQEKKRDLFKNTIFEYSLARAIQDGYVKEPTVAGRENFKSTHFKSDEELEDLKIQDGVQIHEKTKVHLIAYAAKEDKPIIKPFILIVAQDTSHANRIRARIENPQFMEGRYLGKITTVHSKQDGEEEEKMVRDLLSIEQANNTTEIVIHVNMLREGWDVTNLYTIIPFRTANSKTLIEQQIGRGLRLPYGRRTGIPEIDRLTIVSHDRFNEIIDEANKPGSVIRTGFYIEREITEKHLIIREILARWEQGELEQFSETEREMIRSTLALPNVTTLSDEEIIQKLQEFQDKQPSAPKAPEEYIPTIRKSFDKLASGLTLEIPRITVQPEFITGSRYYPFRLDLKNYTPPPIGEEIIIIDLRTGEKRYLGKSKSIERSESLVESIASAILDCTELDATEDNNQKLALDLAQQVAAHLCYLPSESDRANVWFHYKSQLVPIISKQMEQHCILPELKYSIQGSTYEIYPIKTKKEIVRKGTEPIGFRTTIEKKSCIKDLIFSGFKKSLYTEIVFHSDSERRFAVMLEDAPSVIKWLKANDGEIRFIFYTHNERYHPDFVVETDKSMYLCEIKRKVDIETTPVQQKTAAAIEWCRAASRLAEQHQKKPWAYLLIPHDEVETSATFEALASKYTMSHP